MPPRMNRLGTNLDRTRTFDKIARVERPDFEFRKVGVVPFAEVLYQDRSDPMATNRAEVSDHLPLWAEFRINSLWVRSSIR